MSIVFGILAAFAFGTSDFFGGLASRQLRPTVVTGTTQTLSLLVACCAIVLFPGNGPTGASITWGAVAGLGGAAGALALYRGLATGRMSLVATLSGLSAAAIPVLVGLAQGDSLSTAAGLGIVLGIPAIALVSWQPDRGGAAIASGAVWGLLAGFGFALQFIALDRAGTGSGAWPLVAAQTLAVLLTVPLALYVVVGGHPVASRRSVISALSAGLLMGVASLAFLAATGSGQLAAVAVLTAMYPGVTVVLARVVLAEKWSDFQKLGLVTAFAAAALIALGSA